VTVTLDPGADAVPDPLATHAADVVEEGIANAVNHGAASQVQVAVHADDGAMTITVADDGRGPQGGTAGMGSRLMGQYRARWRLAEGDRGAVLTAEIPLPVGDSARRMPR